MQNVIYEIRSKRSGKPYVGQTINLPDRMRRHSDLLRRNKHPNKHLQRAYDMCGWDDFVVSVLEVVTSRKLMTPREQYWIDKLSAVDEGMNVAKVAEGPPMLGRRHSLRTLRLLRNAPKGMLGKSHSEETRSKMREAAKARWRNSAYRKKCCESMVGVPKLSARGRARPEIAELQGKPFVAVDPTGKKYRGKGLKKFCAEHGLSYEGMVAVTRRARGFHGPRYYGRGKNQKGGGWTCRFEENCK